MINIPFLIYEIISELLDLTFIVVGCYIVLRILYNLALTIKELFFVKPLQLSETYCTGDEEDSEDDERPWALVTGSTDGIGLGFCQNLAKRGFNLITVSRSFDKLLKRKAELMEEYPEVLIKCIAMDLSKINKIEKNSTS